MIVYHHRLSLFETRPYPIHYEPAANETEEAGLSIFMLPSENQLLAKQLPTKRTPYAGFGVLPLQPHTHHYREEDGVEDLGTLPSGESHVPRAPDLLLVCRIRSEE